MAGASTLAIVGGSLLAGMFASKMLSPDIPDPGRPEAAPSTDPAKAKADSAAAANQARKRAQAAGGRSSTMLTGPQGLGEIGSQNQQKTTLLGY